MKQKTIIRAEQETLLVTLMQDENGEYELCKEPVIAWCMEIDEKDDYIEAIPLTIDGDYDRDVEWAIQYPYSENNSFKYRTPVDRSYNDERQLLADLIESAENRRKRAEQRRSG